MVQTFMVVRCVSCELFQVQQVKKSSNKWTCKVCTTKQSVIKKYHEGEAAECRKYVQQLNMRQGELQRNKDRVLMPPDEYASYSREDETVEGNTSTVIPPPPAVVQADKSKWSLYMHPKDDVEADDKGDISPQKFEQASKKVKRNTSSATDLDSSGNPYSQLSSYSSSLYSMDNHNNSISTNKKQSKQGLKGITGSKSAYDFSTELSAAETTKSRLTDSVAGLEEGSISLLNTTGDLSSDHDVDDFVQGRRASCHVIPATSKWFKFTDTSKNSIPTVSSFSTSDLNHLL